MACEEADRHVAALLPHVIPLDAPLTAAIASLWPATSHKGLSLGDRACLALALGLREPVLTTDEAWCGLDLPLDIRLLR